MKVIRDFSDYTPWAGAVDTYDKIAEAGKLDELETLLDEWFDGEATITQINDVLWFDYEQVFDALGISTDAEE